MSGTETNTEVAFDAIRQDSSNFDSVQSDDWIQAEDAARTSSYGPNRHRQPTPGMQKAGNYKLGRTSIRGIQISIEQPRGSVRRGTKPNGSSWESRLAAHYGYLTGTTGADGDGIDCFLGPWPEAQYVYCINQAEPGKGTFDEHKLMLGFMDEDHAKRAYIASYDKGWSGFRSIVRLTYRQLRWWLLNGNTNRALELGQLPHDGENTMDEVTSSPAPAYDDCAPTAVRVKWDGIEPQGYERAGLSRVLYALRQEDADDGLLLDAITDEDIEISTDGLVSETETYDALVVEAKRIERVAAALLRVLTRAGGDLKPTGTAVSKPMMRAGAVNQTITVTMADGQTLTIWFHNPDATPRKLKPDDELVSWKWMLNRKDVTIAVAPERGLDLDIAIVARRIMALATKNSAAFVQANKGKVDQVALRDSLRADVKARTSELEGLIKSIEVARAGAGAKAPIAPLTTTSLSTNGAVRALGVADITEIGEENIYVEKEGERFAIKVGSTEGYAVGSHDFSGSDEFVGEDPGLLAASNFDHEAILTPEVLKQLRDSAIVAKDDGNERAVIDAEGIIARFTDGLTPDQLRHFDEGKAESILFRQLDEIEKEIGLNQADATITDVASMIAAAERTLESADMKSSAELCIADAKQMLEAGREYDAARRALDALGYTVGILSPLHQQAKALFDAMTPPAKTFLEMTPDEQRAAMKAERAAVSEGDVEAFNATWLQSTKDYEDVGYRVVGNIPGLGDVGSYRGGFQIIADDGQTYREATSPEFTEIQDAIRGGQVSIYVKPRWRTGGDTAAVMTLHAATGKFKPFDYTFRMVSSAGEANAESDLPAGWKESASGQMATLNDPIVGGIVDVVAQSNPPEWFFIAQNDAIANQEGFASRAEAFAALAAAVAALPAAPAAVTISEGQAGASAMTTQDAVLEALVAAGWTSCVDGYTLAKKSYAGFNGEREAFARLTPGDEYNRTLMGEFIGSGGNLLDGHSALIPNGSAADKITLIVAGFAAEADKTIAESDFVKFAFAESTPAPAPQPSDTSAIAEPPATSESAVGSVPPAAYDTEDAKFLRAVIDGTADVTDGRALVARLKSISISLPLLDSLAKDAARAYSARVVARAKLALAA